MGFAPTDMQLSTMAFENGGAIPRKYTGEGDDVSPALSWTKPPAGCKSFAVICHDPDAPLISKGGSYGFVHWCAYNISGDANGLAEGSSEYTAGKNDFGSVGYNGPMPPNGHGTHHYFFWVFALDKDLKLEAGLTLWQLLDRMEPHVLGMNRMFGTYERR